MSATEWRAPGNEAQAIIGAGTRTGEDKLDLYQPIARPVRRGSAAP
jgi:hypothetical protein